MASFRESMGRFAQSAVCKSKEMAETTRLNLEINSIEQKMREIHIHVGEYLMEHPELLPTDDEIVIQSLGSISELKTKLSQSRQALLDVRNVNICTNCGSEVSRASKFCDRCGNAMDRSVLEQTTESLTCPECGAEIEKESLFCGSCGHKLKE